MKWKVFIVTNGTIVPEYYERDPKFSPEHWTFVNVGPEKMESTEKFEVVNTCDIPGWGAYGKKWAESEVIANVERLVNLSDYDYVGFIHWDFNLHAVDHNTDRITENIDAILNAGHRWISFFPAPYSSITGYYDVMMDERKPNCLFVRDSRLDKPKSSLDFLCDFMYDYGQYTRFSINKYMFNPQYPVALCCSFLGQVEVVRSLSYTIQKLYEKGVFDKYDTEDRHRFPGQVCERLVALYSIFAHKPFRFKLDHRFTGGRELNAADPKGENY